MLSLILSLFFLAKSEFHYIDVVHFHLILTLILLNPSTWDRITDHFADEVNKNAKLLHCRPMCCRLRQQLTSCRYTSCVCVCVLPTPHSSHCACSCCLSRPITDLGCTCQTNYREKWTESVRCSDHKTDVIAVHFWRHLSRQWRHRLRKQWTNWAAGERDVTATERCRWKVNTVKSWNSLSGPCMAAFIANVGLRYFTFALSLRPTGRWNIIRLYTLCRR